MVLRYKNVHTPTRGARRSVELNDHLLSQRSVFSSYCRLSSILLVSDSAVATCDPCHMNLKAQDFRMRALAVLRAMPERTCTGLGKLSLVVCLLSSCLFSALQNLQASPSPPPTERGRWQASQYQSISHPNTVSRREHGQPCCSSRKSRTRDRACVCYPYFDLS